MTMILSSFEQLIRHETWFPGFYYGFEFVGNELNDLSWTLKRLLESSL
jgi:hypothetical protein